MISFLESLKKPTSGAVFNPWTDHDPENDLDRHSPHRRLLNLKAYLDERRNAEYLLLAEALGYQGGHFTGIPMTSERIILGNKSDAGILPVHVCSHELKRTSKKHIQASGFNEPTATIVWGKLLKEGLDTRNFIFWNAFPWHPYKKDQGLLTNRTPTDSELKHGHTVLKLLLAAFKFKKIIALGNKAHTTLQKLGVQTIKVRHPAMGGADLFRKQFMRIINETNDKE